LAVRSSDEQWAVKQSRKEKTEMPRPKGMKVKQREELLSALKTRFEKNMNRHEGLEPSYYAARGFRGSLRV
jgi:hypothetical protein